MSFLDVKVVLGKVLFNPEVNQIVEDVLKDIGNRPTFGQLMEYLDDLLDDSDLVLQFIFALALNRSINTEESLNAIAEQLESNKPSQQDYLSTPHWKSIRKQALDRSSNCCEYCGVSGDDIRLEVHHLTYERKYNELLEDVQVLCVSCHRKAHSANGLAS